MGRIVLRLRPWRAGDEEAFEPRADMAQEARVNAWPWSKGPPGPTWTLMQGDQVLGMGGAVQGEDGAWLAWATVADLGPRFWPEAVRLAGVVIDHMLARADVRWLWAQARSEKPAAIRLLHRLGFRPHHLETVAALDASIVCMLREG